MYPLDEEGVFQKQNDLYELTDDGLLLEAKAMCHDFKSWLHENFDLLPEQMDYLEDIPESVMFGWGAQVATITICRGDLELEFPPDRPTRTKQVDMEVKDAVISYNPEGNTLLEARGLIRWEYLE